MPVRQTLANSEPEKPSSEGLTVVASEIQEESKETTEMVQAQQDPKKMQ